VRALRRHGASYAAIAQAAGVSPMTVHHLLNGHSSQTGQIPHRVGSSQASRLLAVSPPAVTAGRRDACGARRRLQGLVALGHCPADLARQAGITSPRMRRLLAGQTRRVSPALHAAIADLYDQMWNRLPPERTRREQAIADAARRRAEAAGWPPPMALQDDKIDDPAYRPRTAWRRAAGLPQAAQPPVRQLCTADPGGPGFPQGRASGVTYRPDGCQASGDGHGKEGA
jgi:transcriptional regulator with XRE-family HTH domain